jgi:Flp pilus assembly protein TadD
VSARGTLALLCLLAAGGCAGGGSPALQSDPTREHYERILESQRARKAADAEQLAAPADAEQTVSAEEWIARGDRQRRAVSRSEALRSYLQAVGRAPESATPRARIGYLHLQEDPERAAQIFSDVVEREPQQIDGWLGLALARLALGDFKAASRALEGARALEPDAPRLVPIEALLLDQQGKHPDAQRLWARALERRPGDAALLNNLGLSYLASGDFAGAAGAFRRALAVDAKNPISHNNLGLALGRQGDYAGALAAFRRAGPEGAALTNLGWVHHLNGDHEGAIAEYMRALEAPGVDKAQVLRNLEAAEMARLAAPASPNP